MHNLPVFSENLLPDKFRNSVPGANLFLPPCFPAAVAPTREVALSRLPGVADIHLVCNNLQAKQRAKAGSRAAFEVWEVIGISFLHLHLSIGKLIKGTLEIDC